MSDHPPQPRLALAIGMIGHRPNRLPDDPTLLVAIETETEQVLGKIGEAAQKAHESYKAYNDCKDGKGVFTCEPPLLSLVTALAAGADRMAARAARRKGFVLDVALPFPCDEYEKDFRPNQPKPGKQFDPLAEEKRSKELIDEFRCLTRVDRARAVLQLPGRRKDALDPEDPDAKRAYEAVGLTVLSQADILLTIWDGGWSAGRGGTSEMLSAAARAGMPIIHIDADGRAPTRIRWSKLGEYPAAVNAVDDLPAADLDRALLNRLIDELVRPPDSVAERESLERFLAEPARGLNARVEFPLLMCAFAVRGLRSTDVCPATFDKLAADLTAAGAHARSGDTTLIASAYGWADAIGIRFAQYFRSAFVVNFVLGAAAVVLAATSILFPHDKPVFVGIEFLLIVLVIANTWYGRRQNWHRLWFEAREVAERLRAALLFWMLGVRSGSVSSKEPTWTAWYVRALLRVQGMRSGSLDENAMRAVRSVMSSLLREQCRYHVSTARRMHKLGHRLERWGHYLFISTLLAAGLFLIFVLVMTLTNWHPHWYEEVKHLLVVITAGLPAMATAAYGIRVIGDFEGTAHRSRRTRADLRWLITAIRSDPVELGTLRARAQAAADVMLGDVASWRLSAESRGLNIPG